MATASFGRVKSRRSARAIPLGGSATFGLDQPVMRRSAKLAVLASAALALSATHVRAEHAQVKLSYATAKAAPSCPDEATFRGLVAARLGYDPFVSADVRSLLVSYEQRGAEVLGRLELSADGDAKRLSRSLRAAAEECFELATSMALVVAVAVDPNALSGAQPTEPPPPAPAPAAAPPATKNPEPVPAPGPARASPVAQEKVEKPGAVLRLGVGALMGVGVVPAATPGARVQAAVAWGAWSLGVEGEFLAAGARKQAAGSGEVKAYALAGSLVPCVRAVGAGISRVELCAVASVGALRATAREVMRAAPTRTLQASIGPRVAALVALTRSLGLGISADAAIALSRTHLYIEEGGEKREVWAQPPVGFIFATSLVASIW